MSAAWRGTPEAVAVLVNNGAKVDMKDSGVRALCSAIVL